MARMRSLKPEFWQDRKLARRLSRDERMMYLALWNQADEWARAQADPRLLKGQTFPYDDDITLDVIEALIDGLAGAGVLQKYEVDGDPYLFLPKLAKHQRLEPAKVPSRFPEPPPFDPDQQVHVAPQVRANESARDLNESARDAETLPLKHVAGGMEHVAGGSRTGEPVPSDTARKRAHRIPNDFAPTPEHIEWAEARGFNEAQLAEITATFTRHWQSESGAKASKLDWGKAWQNWVARENPAKVRSAAQLSLVGGEPTLSLDQIENLIGPDGWALGAPPDGLLDGPADAYRAWARKTTQEHRAERMRAALSELERRKGA